MINTIISNWTLIILLIIGIPASFIDIKSFRIPDYLTLPGIIVSAVIHIVLKPFQWWVVLINLVSGFFIFFLVRIITKGKLGWGDIKYAAFLSTLMGFFPWLDSISIAVFLALGYYLFLLIIKRNSSNERPIPFAPFLTLGALIQKGINGLELWLNF